MIHLEIKMETIRLDLRSKDFKTHLIYKISKICQQLFSCLEELKLKIVHPNVLYLEPLSEDQNLIFDIENQMYLVDFINFDTHLAGETDQISTTRRWSPTSTTGRSCTTRRPGPPKRVPPSGRTTTWTPSSSCSTTT